jgi:hypothetical protein
MRDGESMASGGGSDLRERAGPPARGSGAALEERDDPGEAAGEGEGLAAGRGDCAFEGGDQVIELQDQRDRAPRFRFLAGLLQALAEEVEVIPAAEGVLELHLAGDAGLESRDAAGGEILRQVARPLDGDAIAVEPPVGRILGRRNQPALDAAPLDLQPERRVVLRMARPAPEVLLEAAALSASRGARGLLETFGVIRAPPRVEAGRGVLAQVTHLAQAREKAPVHLELAQRRERPDERPRLALDRLLAERRRRRLGTTQGDPVVVQAFGLFVDEPLPRLRKRAGAKRPENFRHVGAIIESDRSARLHAIFT